MEALRKHFQELRLFDFPPAGDDGGTDGVVAAAAASIICRTHSLREVLGLLVSDLSDQCSGRCVVYAVRVLFESSPADWLFRDFDEDSFVGEALVPALLGVASHAEAAEFEGREHYAFEEEDFLLIPERAVEVFGFFRVFLGRLEAERRWMAKLSDLMPPLVALVAMHAKTGLWTSPDSSQGARTLLEFLCTFFSCRNPGELLMSDLSCPERDAPTLFQRMLERVMPKLSKPKWKRNPTARSVFVWSLLHTEHPHLSDFLDQVLSAPLLLVDDYVTENKIQGVCCLHHIINNVSGEELKWYSRDSVVYDAVRHQLYTHDAALLEFVIPCMLAILSVSEKPPFKSNRTDTLTKYDDIFQVILFDTEMESKISLRRVYTKYLADFIQVMGLTVVRYLRRALLVIGSYLEISDPPDEEARVNVLTSLIMLIKTAWPRIDAYLDKLLKMLLRLVYDVSIDEHLSQNIKKQLKNQVTEALHLLKLTCPRKVEAYLSPLKDNEVNKDCRDIIRRIFENGSIDTLDDS